MLRDLYADWSQIMAATPDLGIRLLRSLFDEWHQPTVEPQGVTYREDTVGGVPGIWCLPDGADESKVLLYTHGGGFAVGSASSHRKLAAHVAKALGSVSFVLDYRRAPELGHPAQLEDGVSAFDALVASDIAPRTSPPSVIPQAATSPSPSPWPSKHRASGAPAASSRSPHGSTWKTRARLWSPTTTPTP